MIRKKNTMKNATYACAMLLAVACFPACKKDDDSLPPVIPPVVTAELSIEKPAAGWTVPRSQLLRLSIATKLQHPTYVWLVDNAVASSDSVLYFVSAVEGKHSVVLIAKDGDVLRGDSASIVVTKETTAYSSQLARVFEFFPAPGQFVNEMPAYTEGKTDIQMAAQAESDLKGGEGLLSLGSFGGYVVMGFDHMVMNVPGNYNFRVSGNAFGSWSEAGVVEVSMDANGNGLPDDEWYEIAGSEYNSAKTVKNYEITYYKPDANKAPTPDNDHYLTDTTYIRWTDNQGGSGYVFQNSFHSQNYYPLWKGATIKFKGTKLTNEGVYDTSGEGFSYVSTAFAYGYADNWGEDDERSGIKLDWAVDKNGKPVKLPGIQFVRVHTGVLANAGWLGEISTDVFGMEDLNMR